MWGEENSNNAETVTINPWAAGLSQPQAWQGAAAMGRGSSNQPVGGVSASAAAYRGGVGSQQRQWDPQQQQQQQQQMQGNPAAAWAPPSQMAWNQMPPGGVQPTNNWHQPQHQQWNQASNSPSGTYADQAKKNMSLPRAGGPPSLASAAANGPPRLFPEGQQPLGSSNWGGTVKVDQQTPWDTTGNAPPPQQHGDWNSGGGGAARWGQPVGGNVALAPPGAATGWQPTGHPNSLANAPPVTGGADWSAQNPAVLAHRINPSAATQHHDTTGTAHWNAGAPPPVAPTSLMMVATNAGPPPAPGSNWCQPATGGPGSGPPPSTGTDPVNRMSYDPNPQTPGPWVAPQPAEMNNDMMWHDPNPKQKKVQRDTGTSVWGDPSGQRGEIRRWKEAEQEQFSSAHTAVHANSSNADWATLPLTIPTPGFQAQPSEQPQSGWGEPSQQRAQQQQQQQQPANVDIAGTAGWGAPTPTTTTSNSGSSSNVNNTWLPPTTNSSQDGGNSSGDNGLHSEMTYRQTHQNSFGHAGIGSTIAGKDRQDAGMITTTTSNNNSHLSPHIEQIQHAINRKLINVAALTSPAITANPQILLELTKIIKRFMDREQELAKFQQQQHQHQQTAAYKNEEERLICEINSAKSELAELQRSICSGGGSSSNIMIPSSQTNGNPSNSSLSSSTDGQSRLQQWKKTNTDEGKDSIGAGLQSLISSSQSLSIQSGQENGAGNDWKSGALDWSPPSSGVGMDTAFSRKEDQFLALSSASSVQLTNTMSSSRASIQQYNHFDGHDTAVYGHEDTPPGGNADHLRETDHSLGGVRAVDDGPLEFVPGKKWEWRDPNKVAEDPNATPGTCKPNPLLSSAMLGHGGQYSSVGQFGTSQHGQAGADHRNFNAWTGGNATPYPTNNSNPASEMWNNKARSSNIPPVGGPPPSSLINNPPNRLMGPPPSILGPGYHSGNPTAIMPPGNRSQFGAGPTNNAGAYWILFQLVNINDQQIQMICSRVGRLTNFMIVGHKIACAKFADSNMDALMQRLKEAYMFAPQHIKVVPDEEFDKMMRASRASNMPVTNLWSAAPPPNPSEGIAHWSGNQTQTQEMMMGPPPMQHFGGAAPMDELGRHY